MDRPTPPPMYSYGRIRHYSSGSDGSGGDYGYTPNKEFLQSIQSRTTHCIRCEKKVYPTEKVEIGVPLHKNCFRCVSCNVTLTMSNFILTKVPENTRKDIFCKAHAPKPAVHTMDPDSMAVKSAVHAQKISKRPGFNNQIRLKPEMAGWQYDPKAIEFEHANMLLERNRFRRPASHDQEPDTIEYEQGELIRRLRDGDMNKVKDLATTITDAPAQGRRKFPLNTDYMEPNALWSPQAVEDPWHPHFIHTGPHGHQNHPSAALLNERIYGDPNNHVNSVMGQQGPGMKSERIYERLTTVAAPKHGDNGRYNDKSNMLDYMPGSQRNDNAMRMADKKGKRCGGYENVQLGGARRDFMNDKAFIAQNQLELKQRHEHGEMFREFEKARDETEQSVEDQMKQQMEREVQELFRQMDSGDFQGDINVEKLKIEQRFQAMKEEKMRHILDRMNEEERMQLENMIERQAQEMLQLIDKKVPLKLPSPKPPKKRKSQLYTSPQVFDDVDFNALQLAHKEQASFTELMYDLTQTCRNQLEKIRAIFRWLTVKDLNKMFFRQELTEDSPFYFLQGIKYGLESYHELFKLLCSYAGIPVKIVRGFSKSAGYRPGMPFHGTRFRNSWTVVFIDNNWRFVDCHWGARHVTTSDHVDEPENFCYALDEFYFLTDPDDMLYMHFPDEPDWQLLDRPRTQEEFINLPVVKSHFFAYGLKFPSKMDAIIATDSGTVEITLKTTNPTVPLAFNSKLEADDEVLDGYCIYHTDENQVYFDLVLPRRGVFYFSIFACDKDKSDAYNIVCSFRVKCTHVANKPFCKFPKMPDGYGPTTLAKELGMTAEKLSEYYLVVNDEKMIMNLKFKYPVKISHKLTLGNDDRSSEELDRLVFQRYRERAFVSYLLRFPERGVYIFSIFAAKDRSESPMLECVCRYLIQCNSKPASILKPYPKTQQYWQKARLHEPTSGDLKLNKNVKFKLEVQNADAVAVIVGQSWYYLKSAEGSKIWEGMAHTGKDSNSTADVYVRYKESERDFFPLLEYRLVNAE